jgi:hypothetical protein
MPGLPGEIKQGIREFRLLARHVIAERAEPVEECDVDGRERTGNNALIQRAGEISSLCRREAHPALDVYRKVEELEVHSNALVIHSVVLRSVLKPLVALARELDGIARI